jgi:hypothetical protein
MAGPSGPAFGGPKDKLVPAIHALLLGQDVDARHKAGHDKE